MDLYFLYLHGIRGESFAPRHIGEIELLGFQFEGRNGAITATAGGPGNAKFTDITVTKSRDRLSPVLFHASAAGRHFREAVLTTEKVDARGHLVRSIAFHLSSVLIDRVTAPSGQIEEITLSFGGLRMRHA
ncbi:MAG: type VI secretion system tube protein Hcp [Chloracidobacterium sp.]|nr:type VI secretion system tube protein Hcp [Chloracidobacterium sp.]